MKRTGKGFTIVELLTVMAVIAVLIGLLVPALNLVKDHAKEIQQKAQFHGIDVGLEVFKTEFGTYPDSHENDLETGTLDPANYGGAAKLAEALVGWDLLGIHPKTGFRSNGYNTFTVGGVSQELLVYDTALGLKAGTYQEASGAANIEARKSLMVELENANAFRMMDVYGTGNAGSFNEENYVLCDVFARRRVSSVKTGMPILYFKARDFQFQDYNASGDPMNGTQDLNDIYDYTDNQALILLETAEAISKDHELENGIGGTGFEKFEQMILNPQVFNASGIKRPYRAETYILISAGKDGNYGTADDIFNFEKPVTE